MRRLLVILIVAGLSFGLVLSTGCAQKAASASEAIKNSQAYKTVQEKVNYLTQQAQTFYNSKEFQQCVQTAQYVLNNLDKNSQAAKDLITKAKEQLQATAQNAMGNVGNKLFGK